MARYYGDFRSIDTSVDPKGQKYRVLIFSSYNGTVPYQYERIDYMPDPQTGIAPAPVIYPIVGTALTMTDQPFIVSYEGDAENVFKPYRCSTATVSFRQSNINLDFLNSNGTSTLVVLLKWKNEVSETGGRMYNSETGETLNKKYVYENGTEFPLFSGYEPYKYDRFCYSVEWIGFSTPETFSMDYDHTRDNFTLNAQDAFSVLQYKKYEWIGNAENLTATFLNVLLSSVGDLGTYKKIYLTDTLKFPTTTSQTQTGNVAKWLNLQQYNNYDEDNKPTNKLETLTQILTYLNLTAIPYKDNLIITAPNAIADGWSNYNVYVFPTGSYFMTFGGGTYTQKSDEFLSHSHAITAESFTSGGTQISTSNVYNSTTVEDDIYYISDILPNLNDSENFANKTHNSENLTYGNNRYYWRYNSMASAIDAIRTYQYEADSYTYTASLVDDLTQTYNVTYSITFSNQTVDEPVISGTGFVNRPTCIVMDNYGVKTETPTAKNRVIYFHSMPWQYGLLPHWYNDTYMSNPQCQQNFRNLLDTQSKSQKLLEIVSKGFWGNNNLYLQLIGSWTFYHNRFNNTSRYPYQFDSGINPTLNGNPSTNYVYAKVKYGSYWLQNTATQSSYTWGTTETYVKLYYKAESGSKAFTTSFPFKPTQTGKDGIIVKLPELENLSNITISIFRPLGCGSDTASTAILSGFDLQLLTERELFDDEYKGGDDNAEYKSEISSDAVAEFNPVRQNLTSESDHNANYSQVLRTNGNGFQNMTAIYNVATANHATPEQIKVKAMADQYATPTVSLSTNLHAKTITPYSLMTWSQTGNRKYIVNSITYDYEMDTAAADITQIKTATADTTETRRNMTRNYRRNRDLITHERPTRIEREQLTTEPILDATRTFTNTIANGARITTTSEIEGLITLQPQLTGTDNALLVSIPNEIYGNATTNSDGELIITISDPE